MAIRRFRQRCNETKKRLIKGDDQQVRWTRTLMEMVNSLNIGLASTSLDYSEDTPDLEPKVDFRDGDIPRPQRGIIRIKG